MAIPIIKAVLVIVILAVMVALLLGINHLFAGKFRIDSEDAARLREEMDSGEGVITEESVFSEIVAPAKRSVISSDLRSDNRKNML